MLVSRKTLTLIHLFSSEFPAGNNTATQISNQAIVFCHVAFARSIFLQPLAKGGIERGTLLARRLTGLLDQVLVCAQGDVFHTNIVYTVFVCTKIGVFDSGFGGLTVLKALLEVIPDAEYLYFGDTARLPYGSKSVETVAKYACEAAKFLEQQGAQMLVIACNTATALALDRIEQASSVPVIGGIAPGP